MLQAASAVLFEHLHATQELGQILNLYLLNTFPYYFKDVYASKVFFFKDTDLIYHITDHVCFLYKIEDTL